MDPREQRQLGRTGVQVGVLGFGGAAMARPEVDAATAVQTVRTALAAGVRLFDTAPLYGNGASEDRLGAALAGAERSRFVVATKVGRRLAVDLPGRPHDGGTPVFDFSYDGTLRSAESSLRRLGLDRVDVLHIHDPDQHETEAIAGAFRALQRLKEEGVCRAIGAGMNQAEMLTRFADAADFDCFLLAGRYTLLDQIGLQALLPACLRRSIGIIIGGPYNSGILAMGGRPGATYNYALAPPTLLERAIRLEAVGARHGVPLRALALQFPLAHPAVAAVIPGARTADEVADNLRMVAWPIPAAAWQELRAEGLIDPAAPLPTA